MTQVTIPKKTFRKFRKKGETKKESNKRYPELDEILQEMSRIKERGKEEGRMFFELESRAIDFMVAHDLERYDGRKLVAGSSTKLDVELLKRKINDKQWELITRRQFDPELLEAAVERGLISVEVVRMCTSQVPRKAYIYGN